jgi:hypothetical protein
LAELIHYARPVEQSHRKFTQIDKQEKLHSPQDVPNNTAPPRTTTGTVVMYFLSNEEVEDLLGGSCRGFIPVWSVFTFWNKIKAPFLGIGGTVALAAAIGTSQAYFNVF